MWLITPIGFFSIVRKPEDTNAGTLTLRARAKDDLMALRQKYLPELGEIQKGGGTDYPYRARAKKADVAAVMAKLVDDIDYNNFKNVVHERQGSTRAHLYGKVWEVLYKIRSNPAAVAELSESKVAVQIQGPKVHPRKDDHGKTVHLSKPSTPTDLSAWADPSAVACVIPDGPMPAEVNAIPTASWAQPPATEQAWEALAQSALIEEPPFKVPAGLKPAAGAVVREPDGRCWIVAPSNAFGGHAATFPKGKLDGMSLQACALKEVFEEAGLQIWLTHHLIDSKRSGSYTRYYLAERIGGNPADMCWESQAVMLVPASQLPTLLTNPHDQAIVDKLGKS